MGVKADDIAMRDLVLAAAPMEDPEFRGPEDSYSIYLSNISSKVAFKAWTRKPTERYASTNSVERGTAIDKVEVKDVKEDETTLYVRTTQGVASSTMEVTHLDQRQLVKLESISFVMERVRTLNNIRVMFELKNRKWSGAKGYTGVHRWLSLRRNEQTLDFGSAMGMHLKDVNLDHSLCLSLSKEGGIEVEDISLEPLKWGSSFRTSLLQNSDVTVTISRGEEEDLRQDFLSMLAPYTPRQLVNLLQKKTQSSKDTLMHVFKNEPAYAKKVWDLLVEHNLPDVLVSENILHKQYHDMFQNRRYYFHNVPPPFRSLFDPKTCIDVTMHRRRESWNGFTLKPPRKEERHVGPMTMKQYRGGARESTEEEEDISFINDDDHFERGQPTRLFKLVHYRQRHQNDGRQAVTRELTEDEARAKAAADAEVAAAERHMTARKLSSCLIDAADNTKRENKHGLTSAITELQEARTRYKTALLSKAKIAMKVANTEKEKRVANIDVCIATLMKSSLSESDKWLYVNAFNEDGITFACAYVRQVMQVTSPLGPLGDTPLIYDKNATFPTDELKKWGVDIYSGRPSVRDVMNDAMQEEHRKDTLQKLGIHPLYDLLMTTCNRIEEMGEETEAIYKRFDTALSQLDTALSQLEYKFLPSGYGEYTVFHAAARLFKLMEVHTRFSDGESDWDYRSVVATLIVQKVVELCGGDRSKAQVIANQASVFGRTGEEEWGLYPYLNTESMISDSDPWNKRLKARVKAKQKKEFRV